MLEIVAIVFDAAKGDAAKAVDLQNELCACGGSADVDVGFFAHADAIARTVEGRAFEMGVQGEVVEASVGEAIPIV